MNIVIVDDSKTKLGLIQLCVEQIAGVTTTTFEDALSALAWCGKNTLDVLLVDFVMPDLDGIEFIKRFRSFEHTEHVPVLMITATSDKQVLYDALRTGANDFLHSPIDQLELRARVTTMLKVRSGALALIEANEKLYRMATIDDLTQVYNRRRFFEQATIEMARARRYGRALSVVMLDADHFKKINDRYGHMAGDTVLKCLAEICVLSIRPSDFIGRLGGEEFAVCLPETDGDAAYNVAERIRAAIAEASVDADGATISFTVSLGVAEIGAADQDVTSVLSRADEALYRAKSLGRNRIGA